MDGRINPYNFRNQYLISVLFSFWELSLSSFRKKLRNGSVGKKKGRGDPICFIHLSYPIPSLASPTFAAFLKQRHNKQEFKRHMMCIFPMSGALAHQGFPFPLFRNKKTPLPLIP